MNQNKFVPQATLGFKHQTTLVLVSFVLAGLGPTAFTVCVVGFRLSLGCFLAKGLVGADILELMELVKPNVFISFRTSAVQSLVPREIASIVRLRE